MFSVDISVCNIYIYTYTCQAPATRRLRERKEELAPRVKRPLSDSVLENTIYDLWSTIYNLRSMIYDLRSMIYDLRSTIYNLGFFWVSEVRMYILFGWHRQIQYIRYAKTVLVFADASGQTGLWVSDLKKYETAIFFYLKSKSKVIKIAEC